MSQNLSKIMMFVTALMSLFSFGLLADETISEPPSAAPATLCSRLIELKKSPFFDTLNTPVETARFYNLRCETNMSTAWVDANGTPNPDGMELLHAISRSSASGLPPGRYLRSESSLSSLTDENQSTEERLNALYRQDMLYTDAYITLARDLREGITDPKTFQSLLAANAKGSAWDLSETTPFAYADYLTEALRAHRVERSLSNLEPDYAEYDRMRKLLSRYRKIENPSATEQMLIDKLVLNLDRFRMLPKDLETRNTYIDVNIPSFTLKVIDHGYEILDMKTIVGRPERPTPVLSSRISNAILNPSWTAPQTIVQKDILGAKERMGEYLMSHDIRVYQYVGGELQEIDPGSVDWNQYRGKKKIPYTFRTDSGETNPLGKIKFNFPNRHFVYMHDTNAPSLFKKNKRSLSSGCVRLSHPQKLLDYLSGQWENPDQSTPENTDEPDKPLKLQLRPYIVFRYMTLSVGTDGTVTMYDDIYGYDRVQFKSLRR